MGLLSELSRRRAAPKVGYGPGFGPSPKQGAMGRTPRSPASPGMSQNARYAETEPTSVPTYDSHGHLLNHRGHLHTVFGIHPTNFPWGSSEKKSNIRSYFVKRESPESDQHLLVSAANHGNQATREAAENFVKANFADANDPEPFWFHSDKPLMREPLSPEQLHAVSGGRLGTPMEAQQSDWRPQEMIPEDFFAMSRGSRPANYADALDPQEQASFQQNINAEPWNSLHHGAYADWLQDRGHDDEASFHRSMGDWFNKHRADYPGANPTIGRPPDHEINPQKWTWMHTPFPADTPNWHFNAPGGFWGMGKSPAFPKGVSDFGFHQRGEPNAWTGAGDPDGPVQPHHGTWGNGVFSWAQYPHMEEAFRRSFMQNLQQQRAQPQQQSQEPTQSARYAEAPKYNPDWQFVDAKRAGQLSPDPETAQWEAKLRQLHTERADELQQAADEARVAMERELAAGMPEDHSLILGTRAHLAEIARHIADRRLLAQGKEAKQQPTQASRYGVDEVRDQKRAWTSVKRSKLKAADPIDTLRRVMEVMEIHGPMTRSQLLRHTGIPAAALNTALDHATKHGVMAGGRGTPWQINSGWHSQSFDSGDSALATLNPTGGYQQKQRERLSSLPPDQGFARISEVLSRHGELRHGDLARLSMLHPEALQTAVDHGVSTGGLVGTDHPVPNNPKRTVRVWSLPQAQQPIHPEESPTQASRYSRSSVPGDAFDQFPDAVATDPQYLRPINPVIPAKSAALAASMKANGWQGDPLLAVGNQALVGSHRLDAAMHAGLNVPVIFLDSGEFLDAAKRAHMLNPEVRPQDAKFSDIEIPDDDARLKIVLKMNHPLAAKIMGDEIKHNAKFGGKEGWQHADWAAPSSYARTQPVPPTEYADPTDHAYFQTRINKKPNDAITRGVYADWLEENDPGNVAPATLDFLRSHAGKAWVSQTPEGAVIAGKHWTMPEIKAANQAAGRTWFDRGNTRFFGTRLLPKHVYSGPGGVYFVHEGDNFDRTQREYRIAAFHPHTGDTGAWATFHADPENDRDMASIDAIPHVDDAAALARELSQGTPRYPKNRWWNEQEHGAAVAHPGTAPPVPLPKKSPSDNLMVNPHDPDGPLIPES